MPQHNPWQSVTLDEAVKTATYAAVAQENRNLNQRPSPEVTLDLPVLRALLDGITRGQA